MRNDYSRGGTSGHVPRNSGDYLADTPRNGTYDGIYDSRDGFRPTFPDDHYTSVADRVINSQVYKDAYALLSKATDPTWLQRLEAIPYSVSDAAFTWFDEHGLSNKFNDKQDANYQFCIEQINLLVSDYQAFVNSLPSTQADQLAVIGSNAAITGQGLSSSSIQNSRPSTNPSVLDSTSPGEIIGDGLQVASSVLSSVNGGVLSWIQTFNQVNQFNKTFAENVRMNDESIRVNDHNIKKDEISTNLSLAEKGIQSVADSAHAEVINSSDYFYANETEQRVREKKARLEDYTTYDAPPALAGSDLEAIYKDLALTRFNILKASLSEELSRKQKAHSENQYQIGYYSDDPEAFGTKMGEYDKNIKAEQAKIASEKMNFIVKMVKRVNDGSLAASYILDSMLSGLDISTLMYGDGAEAAQKGIKKLLEALDDAL